MAGEASDGDGGNRLEACDKPTITPETAELGLGLEQQKHDLQKGADERLRMAPGRSSCSRG
jgi:hypothetical protein